jgi:hypothetical protein
VVPPFRRMQRDVNVDDVRMTRPRTQHTDSSGRRFIERDHNQLRRGKQSGQLGLTGSAPPSLGDRTDRNRHLTPAVEGQLDERPNAPVEALDSDQGSRVEG